MAPEPLTAVPNTAVLASVTNDLAPAPAVAAAVKLVTVVDDVLANVSTVRLPYTRVPEFNLAIV